jgi:ABC-type multidrug transport system fused ATPase/permease subunit
MGTKSSILKIFAEFLNNYPKQFGLLIAMLVLEGLTSAFSMLSIIPLTDYFVNPSLNNPTKVTKYVIYLYKSLSVPISYWTFGLLFIGLNLLKALFEVGIKYVILRLKYTVLLGLYSDSLGKVFKAKWSFFSNSSYGMLLNSLNKEMTNVGDSFGHLAIILSQTIQLFIFLFVPLWLNASLTLTILMASVALALPFLTLNKLSYRLGKKNIETANQAIGFLNEVLQGAKLIIGFGKQSVSIKKFINLFSRHIIVTLKSQILSSAIPKIFQPIALAAIIFAIGFELNKSTPIAEIASVMWSFLTALPILVTLIQGNLSLNNFIPSYEQLQHLRQNALLHKETSGSKKFINLYSSIEFRNINFTFPGRETTLFDINLVLRKGSMVALVGESGSGKSTIADLMLGLYPPDRGEVFIDNYPLSTYDINSFRQKVGYVPQEPMLFHSSIKDNLLWSNENASENDIFYALKLANAFDFINELPNGLDTVVGDRGIRLSGGQRQRIALARALLRNPDLLILDEATSALDSESERLIQLSIEKVAKNTTILVIAHRLSTISKANFVYVLGKGKIIEKGEYEYLASRKDSLLSNMILAQVKN